MLRSSTPTETADMQAFRGLSCRGEDSNLCFRGEHHLTVGAPQRDGLQQIAVAGLLVPLAILIPWIVLYTIVLGGCGRWSARQWRPV